MVNLKFIIINTIYHRYHDLFELQMQNDKTNYSPSVELNRQNHLCSADFHYPWSEMQLQARHFCFSNAACILRTSEKDQGTYKNTQQSCFLQKPANFIHIFITLEC